MQIDPVRVLGGILIQHGDDVGTAILHEADVGDLSLSEKFLRALRHGAFRMLTHLSYPVAFLLIHDGSPVCLASLKLLRKGSAAKLAGCEFLSHRLRPER